MSRSSLRPPVQTGDEALRAPGEVRPVPVQRLNPPHLPALDTFKARPDPDDGTQAWLLRLP